jgi:hypothetical protein
VLVGQDAEVSDKTRSSPATFFVLLPALAAGPFLGKWMRRHSVASPTRLLVLGAATALITLAAYGIARAMRRESQASWRPDARLGIPLFVAVALVADIVSDRLFQ